MALVFWAAVQRPMVEAELSGQCQTEHLAVYLSGFAHFDVANSCGSSGDSFKSGLREVTAKELKNLSETIAAVHFESLPDRIEPDPHVVGSEEDLFLMRVW